ncbi:MAG: hypothetical protein IJ875_04560 [Solobacterium sp.]|nr:hypothetical protein [Solobacterium sp.]
MAKQDANKKTYTAEEIKKMSYWQLWGLRRQTGLFYFLVSVTFYSFLLYLFFKVIYMSALKQFGNFQLDWWAIPVCILIGLIYYYGHEAYYKSYIQKHPDQAV